MTRHCVGHRETEMKAHSCPRGALYLLREDQGQYKTIQADKISPEAKRPPPGRNLVAEGRTSFFSGNILENNAC